MEALARPQQGDTGAADAAAKAPPGVPTQVFSKEPARALGAAGAPAGAAAFAEPLPPGAAAPAARAAEALGRTASPTAEKLARGVVAVGLMLAASISQTAAALGGALDSFGARVTSTSPPLSQPLTVHSSYVSRLTLLQAVTHPAANAAAVAAQWAGEALYYLLQAAWAVYCQLAAMKLLPQLTSGAARAADGVPLNPVRNGLPMASDELAAFKLVGAALVLAYVQIYDALEEAATVLFRHAAAVGESYLAHRHGGEAADVASAALSVAGDLLMLTLNWFRLMGRGLVSRTATSTARRFLHQQLPDLKLD